MQITLTGDRATGYTTSMQIAAGETVAESLSIGVGGKALNLTGYALKMQINFPAPLLLSTSNGGIAVTNAAGGTAQINVADSQTAGFPVGTFAYDFWMISGGGVATRILTGLFAVEQALAPIP